MGEFRKKKYISTVLQEKKDEEFMYLKQRTMSEIEYEEKFIRLSKYVPEMVNTVAKRRRCFQQGLTMEIQNALVTARVETYAEMVEMAQRIEDSKAKVRELQNARKVGPKPWMGRQSGPSSGTAKPPLGNVRGQPQKRPSGTSATPPASD